MNKLHWVQNKICTVQELMARVHAWRVLETKIVFTNGVFDLLHRGHVTYLAQAASLGNKMIMGVNSDASVKRLKGSARPIQNENDRALILASLQVVDAVCIFNEDTPLELIKSIRPNVLCKGGDYTIETIVGAQEVMANGGKVEIISFEEGYSSTGIIDKLKIT